MGFELKPSLECKKYFALFPTIRGGLSERGRQKGPAKA